MQVSSDCRPIGHLDGVVRRVDPVNREVEVHAGGTTVCIDIRPDCVITLRGERVKLRLIQPRDRVRVAYTEYQGARVADAVEVQPLGMAALEHAPTWGSRCDLVAPITPTTGQSSSTATTPTPERSS